MTASYQTGTGYRDSRRPERGGRAGLEDLAIGRLIRPETARDLPCAFGACFGSWPAVRGGGQRGIMAMPGLANAALVRIPAGRRPVHPH